MLLLISAGLGLAVPVGDGPDCGPVTVVCWAAGIEPWDKVLLAMSTGISMMEL